MYACHCNCALFLLFLDGETKDYTYWTACIMKYGAVRKFSLKMFRRSVIPQFQMSSFIFAQHVFFIWDKEKNKAYFNSNFWHEMNLITIRSCKYNEKKYVQYSRSFKNATELQVTKPPHTPPTRLTSRNTPSLCSLPPTPANFPKAQTLCPLLLTIFS